MDRRKALKKAGLLAGATIAMPSLFSLLQSCKTETRLDWQPEFFTEAEAKTISALIDTILPTTDSPGGLDVKADMFIDKVVAQTYDAEGQQNMRKAIAVFNATSKEKYGSVFYDLSDADKASMLQEEESKAPKFNPGIWGTTVGEQKPVGFYRSMKSMAIWAYFTSEEIGENVLSYDPIPGGYEACKPLSDVGNRWSL